MASVGLRRVLGIVAGYAVLPLAGVAALWILTAPDTAHAPPPNFGGFLCRTAACTDHRAGYAWAASVPVIDAASCAEGSASFNEGCRAWLQHGPGLLGHAPAATDEDG